MDLEIIKGKDIQRYFEPFTQLRMAFYRDYPYLYAGNKEFERKYFSMFTTHEDSRLIVAKEEDKIVGAILGAPLKATAEEVQRPYKEQGKSIDTIYYLGDILVQKDHRDQGIGSALYEEFESIIRSMKKYQEIDLYEIARSDEHPRKPKDYKPIEDFWKKRGYTQASDLKAEFAWKEIGEKQESSPHSMAVYLKKVA